MRSVFQNQKLERWIEKLMLLFLVITISAASFEGFFSKWSFRDDAHSFGIERMLEGTADRPYVYRRLLPEAAKAIVSSMPTEAKDKLEKKLSTQRPAEDVYARSIPPASYRIEYYLLMAFCYLFLVASVYLYRSIFSEITKDSVAGTLTAFLFALIFPYLEALGGYYYDIPEIFFFGLAVRCAMNGRIVPFLFLSIIATLNKEAFFFFLLTMFPFFRLRYGTKKAACVVAASIVLSGIFYAMLSGMYVQNPGERAQFHFIDHIVDFVHLNSYLVTSTTYGLPLASGFFVTHVLYVIWIAWMGWQYLPDVWKTQTKLAALVNVPLYLLFANPGEVRNLSLLYVSFFVMLAYWLHHLLRTAYDGMKK